MNLNCEIVADLLPSYLDNTCSEESRRAVETHMAECPACRELLETLRAETEEAAEPALNESAVLQKTSRAISKRAIGAAVGVTAIVIYWLVYFWLDHLANWGDYRYFSYTFYELWVGVGWLLVPSVTALWLVAVLYCCIRERSWRRNGALLCALLVLVVSHAVWTASLRDVWQSHSWTTIEEVGEDYIVIPGPEDSKRVLKISPMICGVLVADEQEYEIVYTHKIDDHTSGKLVSIRAVERPEGEEWPSKQN